MVTTAMPCSPAHSCDGNHGLWSPAWCPGRVGRMPQGGRAPDTRPTHRRLWSRFGGVPRHRSGHASHPTQPGAPTSLGARRVLQDRASAPAPSSSAARQEEILTTAARDDLGADRHIVLSKPAGTEIAG